MPLHEWSYPLSDRPETIDDSDGSRSYASPEPQTELTTWIFDEGTFVPSAKIVGERRYSIISDYLGTPVEAYDEEGRRVWARELDIYGRVRIEQGEVELAPFLYQGQYLDTETGLTYNRFRYYSPEIGAYISQDPIRLEAGLTNLYAYVHDVNAWIDPWGLIKVSTTVALQDVMNRGLHVNVIEGKKSFHVALEAIMDGEIPKGIKLVPADPQARKIDISKKVEEAIRDYMKKINLNSLILHEWQQRHLQGLICHVNKDCKMSQKHWTFTNIIRYIEDYKKKSSTHRKDEVGIYFRRRVYS